MIDKLVKLIDKRIKESNKSPARKKIGTITNTAQTKTLSRLSY